jgi:cell division protein FtsB
MAKALFGSVVAPHELRVAEENAALRARVRQLEAKLALLQEERDAAIARELLGMAEDRVAASSLAGTSA